LSEGPLSEGPPPQTSSIYEEAAEEISRHAWIASEAAGRDIGGRAAEEWNERHWPGFLRYCYLRHLAGERNFRELPRGLCGAFRGRTTGQRRLRDEVTGLLRRGAENLDILRWALDRGEDISLVCEILLRIDINSVRFPAPRELGKSLSCEGAG